MRWLFFMHYKLSISVCLAWNHLSSSNLIQWPVWLPRAFHSYWSSSYSIRKPERIFILVLPTAVFPIIHSRLQKPDFSIFTVFTSLQFRPPESQRTPGLLRHCTNNRLLANYIYTIKQNFVQDIFLFFIDILWN